MICPILTILFNKITIENVNFNSFLILHKNIILIVLQRWNHFNLTDQFC